MLKTSRVNDLDLFTPTKWQTVILRNFGLVEAENIAKVLGCSVKRVEIEAARLGIDRIPYNPLWRERSYLTIIRNNWNLLNYEQLLTLSEMSEEELSYQLKNNDFLGVKLGNFKPDVEPIRYAKLTKEESRETRKSARLIKKHFIEDCASPFSFEYGHSENKIDDGHDRIIYPYSLEYGDVFLKSSKIIGDEELKAYASNGVTGLWIGATLRDLCHYPFSEKIDKNYVIRRQNLNEFIKTAKSYGLKTFLYLNEPRGIDPKELKPEYEHLKGRAEGDLVSLCLSHPEVQDYLYEATKELVTNVPDLAGIITITSSENLTHCKHIPGSECKACAEYRPYELAAMINNLMFQAIEDSGSKTRLIANLWGWAPYCGYLPGEAKKGIDLLNPHIEVMCVSEFGTHKKGKRLYEVGEYSLSNAEPCIETIQLLNHAKKKGHKVLAKIQVNNSWEMSAVPYLPCFENVLNHLNKLRKIGVEDYMLSWTLGGYPSIALSLTSAEDYDAWLKETFKENCETVKTAVHAISMALAHFPFDTHLLYLSPLNLGPANPIYRNATGRKATMVTFPYDDIDSWVTDKDAFVTEMGKVIRYFKKALKMLDGREHPSERIQEIIRYLKVWTICYESTLNQYLFNLDKADKSKNLNKYLKKELSLTLQLYGLAASDATIGFEASNQYIFTPNMFLEKILNLRRRY